MHYNCNIQLFSCSIIFLLPPNCDVKFYKIHKFHLASTNHVFFFYTTSISNNANQTRVQNFGIAVAGDLLRNKEASKDENRSAKNKYNENSF